MVKINDFRVNYIDELFSLLALPCGCSERITLLNQIYTHKVCNQSCIVNAYYYSVVDKHDATTIESALFHDHAVRSSR